MTPEHLRASVILSVGNPTCSITNTNSNTANPTCNLAVNAAPLGSNGLQGEEMYFPSNPVSDPLKASSTPTQIETTVTMQTSGQAGGSGSIATGTAIPFYWDFSVTLNGQGMTLLDYSVQFNISTSANGTGSVFLNPVNSGQIALSGTTANVSGSLTGFLNNQITAGLTYYQTAVLILDVSDTDSGNRSLSLSIPLNSFDFNEAPEPATLSLSALAVAGLLFGARRRKASAV